MKRPPYSEAVTTEEGIELRDSKGLTTATVTGATPEAESLINAAPAMHKALVDCLRCSNEHEITCTCGHLKAREALQEARV